MKILMVGSNYNWSIERFYLKYLNHFNIDTNLFPAKNILYDFLSKNLINKLSHRIKVTNIYNKINKDFRDQIDHHNPDIVWVFKGMEIFPESLQWAKSRKIKLVNYNPDNPFIFTGRGSGNRNVTQSLSLYDLHLTYSYTILDEIIKKTKLPTKLLPFGYDLSGISSEIFEQKEKFNALCFLGNPDKQRMDFIKKLLQNNISINIFGHDWDKFIKHPLAHIHHPVYNEEFYNVVRSYRIQLNLLRIHNLTSHNMRSFEIPSIGGIQLAPYTTDHSRFFEDGKEIFLFRSLKDFLEKRDYLLNSPLEKIQDYREAAKNKSSSYSYLNRTKEVITHFKSL